MIISRECNVARSVAAVTEKNKVEPEVASAYIKKRATPPTLRMAPANSIQVTFFL